MNDREILGSLGVRTEDDDRSGNAPLPNSKQDLVDLQNELAGRETGRPERFRLEGTRDGAGAEARRSRDRAYRTALDLLRQDAEYAALYDEVSNTLETAQSLTDQALAQANARIDEAAAKLEKMEERASTLDGIAVFRSADGRVFTVDGRELPADELDGVEWKDDAPSWEEYRRQKEALQKAAAERDAILSYQHQVLDSARDRLNDQETPPSKSELDEIQQAIEEQAPPAIRAELQPDTPTTHQADKSSFDVGTPTL